MPAVEVTNLAEIKAYLDALPADTFDKAKTAFQEAVFAADTKTKSNATNKLKVRTGNLKRSIMSQVSGKSLSTLNASVYTAAVVGGGDVIYAPIHEFGGTVRAIDKYLGVPGGPYLNIPTSANKTASGVTRLQAREVFNRGGYITQTKGGVWGVFLLGQMMFSLKKQVKIPARLGMIDAAEDEVPTLLNKLRNVLCES